MEQQLTHVDESRPAVIRQHRRPAALRGAAAVILALLCSLAALSPALAHAELVRSDPADGAALAKPPRQVRLWFSEALAPGVSQARVLDVGGQAVAGVALQFDRTDPSLLMLALPPLPDGQYTIAYSIVSADDGHASSGRLTFTAGGRYAASASAAGQVSDSGAPVFPSPLEVGLRWLNFTALAGLAGGLAVAMLVLGRGARRAAAGLRQDLLAAEQQVLAWAFWCNIAALAVGLGLLAWQMVGLAAAAGPGGAISLPGLAWALLSGAQAGRLWLLRQALLVASAALLFARLRGQAAGAGGDSSDDLRIQAAGLLAVAVLGTQAFSSHAAALASDAYPAILADWLHLSAAGLWTGGLLALAFSLLPPAWRRRHTPAAAALVRAGFRPFGGMAAISVGVLAATGLYSLGRQVASPDALLTTLYGQTLLVKSALVLGAGALGLLNSSLLHPRLAAPLARLLRRTDGWTPVPPRRLPWFVLGEAGLALLVLLATGIITSSVPAHGPAFAPRPAGSDTLGEHAADLMVIFHADPNQAGSNTFTADVLDRNGPPAGELRVNMRFTFLGQDVGTVTAAQASAAQPVADGRYQVVGRQVSLPGPWQADVVVRRRGLEDVTAHFRWTVAPLSRPVVVSDRPLEPYLTPLAALIFSAILLICALLWLRRLQMNKTVDGGIAAPPDAWGH